MRVVLDCNVIISGLIRPDGPPAQVVKILIQGRFEAVLSPAILMEYRCVLEARKVRRYLRLSPDAAEALLSGLALAAFWVEDRTSASPIALQDPSDDIYLLAAAEGRADYIVSGDRHLLAIHRYEGIPILPPRDFLQAPWHRR